MAFGQYAARIGRYAVLRDRVGRPAKTVDALTDDAMRRRMTLIEFETFCRDQRARLAAKLDASHRRLTHERLAARMAIPTDAYAVERRGWTYGGGPSNLDRAGD